MKFKVSVEFDVESSEYLGVLPTENAVRQLVRDMLNRIADMPGRRKILVEKKGEK